MPGLTIGWEYLTGNCVATDPASRERAEWPPHPGRVFMALAAAWFETGEEQKEGDALRWLEQLGDPQLVLPFNHEVSHRRVVTAFVPVNDTGGPSAALLQSAPSITRSKQPRTFPSVWVGEAPCYLHWPNAEAFAVETHRSALKHLCEKVTRIGHSSSIVRMWVGDGIPSDNRSERWIPDEELAELQVRKVTEGTLSLLERQFNRRGRDEHDLLSKEFASLKAAKKGAKSKGAKERKAELDDQVAKLTERLKSVDNREPIRPALGLWSGYRRHGSDPQSAIPHSAFDSDLLILTQIDGPRLPLTSTLAITRALRGAILRHSVVQPPPSWASGHLDDRNPLRDGQQHLAYVPLPFVGSEYADGHLLGVALAFPQHIPRPDRGRVLGRIVMEPNGRAKPITLTIGAIGVWTLIKRDWTESRRALVPETWTAHPRGAKTWATVTPVVLDRFPKADRIKDRAEWQIEVAGIIATACKRIGLAEPVEVDFGTTSWHLGSPRALVKHRPLRGHSEVGMDTASLGDGFPIYPQKGSNGPRPQFHALLRFAEPVVGPIVLGAGRFMGYGLCKPLRGDHDR